MSKKKVFLTASLIIFVFILIQSSFAADGSVSTIYLLNATCGDGSCNGNETGDSCPGDCQPIISSINHSGITNESAVVNWTTDKLSNSSVNYGINISILGTKSQVHDSVTEHSINLTGLTGSTQYFYNISSCHKSNCQINGTFNFTASATPAEPSPPGPSRGGGGGSKGRTIFEYMAPPVPEEVKLPFVTVPGLKRFPAKELMGAEFEKPLVDIKKLLAIPTIRIIIIAAVLSAAFIAGFVLSRKPVLISKAPAPTIPSTPVALAPNVPAAAPVFASVNELVVRNNFWLFKKEMSQIFVTYETDQLPKPGKFIFGDKTFGFEMFKGSLRDFFKEALDSGPLMTMFGNKIIFAIKNNNKEFISLFKGEEFRLQYPGISQQSSDIYYINKKHNFDPRIQENLWKMLEPKEFDTRTYFARLLDSVNKVRLKSAEDLREYLRNIAMIIR